MSCIQVILAEQAVWEAIVECQSAGRPFSIVGCLGGLL